MNGIHKCRFQSGLVVDHIATNYFDHFDTLSKSQIDQQHYNRIFAWSPFSNTNNNIINININNNINLHTSASCSIQLINLFWCEILLVNVNFNRGRKIKKISRALDTFFVCVFFLFFPLFFIIVFISLFARVVAWHFFFLVSTLFRICNIIYVYV